MITWPASVIEALAQRRAVVFIGAGISAGSVNMEGSRPPNWTELLTTAAEKCPSLKTRARKLIRNGDLLTACELIGGDLAEDWPRFLDAQLSAGFKHNKNHEHIHNLKQQVVVTPNFDKIYDAYASTHVDSVIVKWARDYDVVSDLRQGKRLLLKVHGTIDHPESIILTRSAYAAARVKEYAFFRVIDSLLLLNTTLFLGCGLSDPDIQLILENQSLRHNPGQPHYFVTAEKLSSEEQKILKNTRGLRVIKYSSSNGHIELTESLADLVEKVANARKGFLARQIERESMDTTYAVLDV
ncbi:SIR2 family protein [Myxococcus llanfairpwllgwyngyllgogerychwyrndrobwllllantysiliogogogochensis]|uniref:SIR2 family protein n=1 Tax=Myxococcus llanfairpwllgwyngyllgogerychwyrndrobwllllantysiliogogogochensis TaxID=2590453 RepID=A0A540X6J8_9BACT|nr:SIR2 family protein [Myxococcus llanfairpwllgwyngyllgogerychwyrndrobwllllantysiliogogogochensis]TQF16907.1 SIR2 family protein [Myxococcus llanfairpwllgwyngyllgogerychwyrndrobwllllantysiliogogogochensis]